MFAGVVVGDVGEAKTLSGLLRTGDRVPASLLAPTGASDHTADESPTALVCSCNSVTRGQLIDAIRGGGLSTLAGLGRATRAGTGCGSCVGDLEALLAQSSASNAQDGEAKPLDAGVAA